MHERILSAGNNALCCFYELLKVTGILGALISDKDLNLDHHELAI